MKPITTQVLYLNTSALRAYLSLSCAAYGSVWRTATITSPPAKVAIAALSKEPKEKVHFSYESNPGFFLQSGSIITTLVPGSRRQRGPLWAGRRWSS